MLLKKNVVKNTIKSFLVYLFIILICFLLFDFFLKIFDPQNIEPYKYNEFYGREYRLNFEGRSKSFHPGDYNTQLVINSMGLRDFEHDYFKDDRLRILSLGNSFTFGWGVEMEESYPKVMEEHLGTNVAEVINGGFGGFSLGKQIRYYRHELKKYDSDIILWGIYLGGDISKISNFNKIILNDSQIFLEEKQYPVPEGIMRLRRSMARNSHAYMFFIESLAKNNFIRNTLTKLGFFIPIGKFLNEISQEEIDSRIDDTLILIKTFSEEIKSENKTLLIVMIPYKAQVINQTEYSIFDEDASIFFPNQRILKFCKNEGLICFDTIYDFIKSNDSKSLFFENDNHLNKYGQRFVGDITFEKFKPIFLKSLNEMWCNEEQTKSIVKHAGLFIDDSFLMPMCI